MGHETLHNKVLESYLKYLTLRDSMAPSSTLNIAHACMQLQNDIKIYKKIQDTCYINPWTSILKDGSIHLAWEYAKDPAHHHLFVQMMRVSPYVFAVILELIKNHDVFQNNSMYLNHQLISSWQWLSFRWDTFGMLHPWLILHRKQNLLKNSDCCFTAIWLIKWKYKKELMSPILPEYVSLQFLHQF